MTYTRLSASSAKGASDSASRRALLDAFAKLALSRRYPDFGVGAIVRSARVARSTFYYHFSGKDALLLENLQPFVAVLADMPFTAQPSAELEHWVAHIWQQRRVAHRLLAGATGQKIEAALVSGLNDALAAGQAPESGRNRLLAHQIAGACLALLRAWVGHHVTASPPQISQALWDNARSSFRSGVATGRGG